MELNPPRRVRAALYLSAMFGTPTVLWASTTDRIGQATTILLGSYLALISGLATANTVASDAPLRNQRGAVDVVTVLVVVVLVVLILVLLGFLR